MDLDKLLEEIDDDEGGQTNGSTQAAAPAPSTTIREGNSATIASAAFASQPAGPVVTDHPKENISNSQSQMQIKPQPPSCENRGGGFGGRRNFVKKTRNVPTPLSDPSHGGPAETVANLSPPNAVPPAPVQGNWDDWDDEVDEDDKCHAIASSTCGAPPEVARSEERLGNERGDDLDSLLAELNKGSPSKEPQGVVPASSLASAYSKQTAAAVAPPSAVETSATIKGSNRLVASTSANGMVEPTTVAAALGTNQNRQKQKCKIVLLGGPAYSAGISFGIMSKTVCSKMRCLKCDFLVCTFDGMRWNADVDYIFFRNNTPNEAKLSSKLTASASERAYCCQCSWISVSEITKVGAAKQGGQKELRWVCASHIVE